MTRVLSLLCAMFLLAGCMPGPDVTRLPKWQKPADLPRFGDWIVDDCTILANAGEVRAESSGKLSGGVMPVTFHLEMPLVRPPQAQMSGLPVALPLDGTSWTFRTYLAYDATTVAHMMDPGTFLMLSYQPLNTSDTRQIHFDTRGLLQAAVHVGKVCGR